MFGKPKLAPALFCILTFCVVSVVIVDAAPVPFLVSGGERTGVTLVYSVRNVIARDSNSNRQSR